VSDAITAVDDLGGQLRCRRPPIRIVSLVPSVTELLFALGVGDRLIGATRFCDEPAAARRVRRVGGTKNPDVAQVSALAPDVVLANAEENRREDVEALRAAGIPVFVTYPRTVSGAIDMVRTLGTLLATQDAAEAVALRLEAARDAMVVEVRAAPRLRVFCPIWKRPWMTFNRDTFAHDMLATVGGVNIFADRDERYPVVEPDAVVRGRPEVVLLPSEPYHFRERDLSAVDALFVGTEARRVVFIDGQALTWHGPRIDSALRVLRDALTVRE
jgi:ABC-type Fe3+-hydroxamate transport system substrate-binding protein